MSWFGGWRAVCIFSGTWHKKRQHEEEEGGGRGGRGDREDRGDTWLVGEVRRGEVRWAHIKWDEIRSVEIRCDKRISWANYITKLFNNHFVGAASWPWQASPPYFSGLQPFSTNSWNKGGQHNFRIFDDFETPRHPTFFLLRFSTRFYL